MTAVLTGNLSRTLLKRDVQPATELPTEVSATTADTHRVSGEIGIQNGEGTRSILSLKQMVLYITPE